MLECVICAAVLIIKIDSAATSTYIGEVRAIRNTSSNHSPSGTRLISSTTGKKVSQIRKTLFDDVASEGE